ncbi:MAG: hypothetical protein H7X71_02220 [Chitinophagales bacterium]|nr:hypothetical protein [Chitinophagales bacterium]
MKDLDWLQVLIMSVIFIAIVAALYCIYIYGVRSIIIIAVGIILSYLLYRFLR